MDQQAHREDGTCRAAQARSLRRTVRLQRAAVPAGDLVGDGQSQTGTTVAVGAGGLDALKALK